MKKGALLLALFFCSLQWLNGQPGKLDPSFGNKGIVRTDLGKDYSYKSSGRRVLTQADGSSYAILQTLDQAVITKINANGSTDSSYGQHGFSTSIQLKYTSAAILQPDGKILLGGANTRPFEYYFVVARFNGDGSLDSSFSDDGINSNISGYSSIGELVLIPQNEKIVAGVGTTLSRYNSNGTLDSTFGTGGIQMNDFEINGAAIQNDGKIVVAGNRYVNPGDTSSYFVARYNTDGSPDATFGDEGKQATGFNSANNYAKSVVIQTDGKIVVGGTALVRYNTDGSLDNSFSNDGIVNTNFSLSEYEQDYSLALQPDQKIVVAGNTPNNGTPDFTIARYNTNGSIDKTFSGDGLLVNDFEIASMAVQRDSRIIIAGSVNANFALARYTEIGTPDNTFGQDGKLTDSIHSGYTIYNSIAIQKDGKVVVAGKTWNGSNFDLVVARYNIDGSLDSTFSGDGVQTNDFTAKDDYAKSVAIQSDGKIVVVGGYTLARYNIDGSLDNTFSGDGLQTTDSVVVIRSMAVQTDGKIVVAGHELIKDEFGYEHNTFAVCRYNTNGSVDNTFDRDGKQTIVFSSEDGENDGYASSVVIQKDGKIVVGGIVGGYYSFTAVARLNTDGSLDNGFGNNEKTGGVGTSDAKSFSVAMQGDGKIVVGGYYYYRGNNGNFINRLNPDGKTDDTFRPQITEFSQGINYPGSDFGNVVAIQSDGKIVVIGAAFTRYSVNGGLDSTFGIYGIQPTGVNERREFINAITIAGNKLYAVGTGRSPGYVGLVARYLLNDTSNTPPTLTLTAPTNNASYLAPANPKLTATASDADGTVTKVEFYKGSTLLHTEYVTPYGFRWRNVPVGNYTLTAKAYDNSGLVTTSAPVHISVVPNKPPVVSIIKPKNNEPFAAPAYIHFEADAKDVDGRITRVEFFNGSTLLNTQYQYPYTYVWRNLPVGTYTITAVATDNWGAHPTSAPVTFRVIPPKTIVSSKRASDNNKPGMTDAANLKLAPNPAINVLNIYTTGLQQDKPATISVISSTGVVMKTMQANVSTKTIQLDVSSFVKGVYTIKFMNGNKVLYKKFVKL